MAKQKRLDTRYAWIEASLRYAGVFDKVSYGRTFDINPPQISADQQEFVLAFNHEARYRDDPEGTDGPLAIVKGKIAVLSALPKDPVFDIPDMRDWLKTMSTIPFVQLNQFRRVDPEESVLSAICEAILKKKPISIRYFSQSSGETMRIISPHSIVDTNGRLHVRSFDHEKDRFSDFVMTRIDEISDAPKGQKYEPADSDLDWRDEARLEIRPNPVVDEDQTRVVISDYGIDAETKARNIQLPKALSFYLKVELVGPTDGYVSPIVVDEEMAG